MLRLISSFGLTLFLFVTIIGTAYILTDSQTIEEQNIFAQVTEKKDNRLTIKEIEAFSADNNFYFTSANALR